MKHIYTRRGKRKHINKNNESDFTRPRLCYYMLCMRSFHQNSYHDEHKRDYTRGILAPRVSTDEENTSWHKKKKKKAEEN